MVHIFLHHSEDAQGHALAALVRHCDAQTHRQFRFLEVDGPASMQRMKRFLQQHGLHRAGVKLPFIILVEQDGQRPAVRRSILHGAAMQQWLAEMVDALLDTPSMTPMKAQQLFLQPFISPHILRVMQYAYASEETTVRPMVEPMPPPPAVPPPPPAFVEELPDDEPVQAGPEPDDNMLVDGGVTLSMASLPVPRQGMKEKGVVKGRKDIDHLQDAKARDAMINQRNNWFTP